MIGTPGLCSQRCCCNALLHNDTAVSVSTVTQLTPVPGMRFCALLAEHLQRLAECRLRHCRGLQVRSPRLPATAADARRALLPLSWEVCFGAFFTAPLRVSLQTATRALSSTRQCAPSPLLRPACRPLTAALHRPLAQVPPPPPRPPLRRSQPLATSAANRQLR